MFYVVISYWAIIALYVLSIPNIYLAGLLPGLAIIASNNTEEGREPGFMARALYRLSVLGFIPLFCWVFSFAVLTRQSNRFITQHIGFSGAENRT